jgi:hypothetical protein
LALQSNHQSLIDSGDELMMFRSTPSSSRSTSRRGSEDSTDDFTYGYVYNNNEDFSYAVDFNQFHSNNQNNNNSNSSNSHFDNNNNHSNFYGQQQSHPVLSSAPSFSWSSVLGGDLESALQSLHHARQFQTPDITEQQLLFLLQVSPVSAHTSFFLSCLSFS